MTPPRLLDIPPSCCLSVGGTVFKFGQYKSRFPCFDISHSIALEFEFSSFTSHAHFSDTQTLTFLLM